MIFPVPVGLATQTLLHPDVNRDAKGCEVEVIERQRAKIGACICFIRAAYSVTLSDSGRCF